MRVERDDAVIVRGRRHRRADLPGAFGTLRAEPEFDAAVGGPGQAEIDPRERPAFAVAPVIDDQVAALEAELREIVAVEAAGPEPVDPGQQRRQFLVAGALRRRGGCGRRGCRGGRSCGIRGSGFFGR